MHMKNYSSDAKNTSRQIVRSHVNSDISRIQWQFSGYWLDGCFRLMYLYSSLFFYLVLIQYQ